MNASTLPHFFSTDMEADVEYLTHQDVDGLHVTATLQEDEEVIGSITYGPLKKLSPEQAATYRLETWGGTEPMPFQDCEAFEAEVGDRQLVIFVRWNDAYYMGCAIED